MFNDFDVIADETHPQAVLHWAVDTFEKHLVTVTSFQPTGIVTLHMLQQIGAQVDVITLDTGFLFPETNELIEQIETRFNLEVQRVRSSLSVAAQAETYGDRLWADNPDQCCHLRKTLPLKQTLQGYEAWITGLRRDQSSNRLNTRIISWDERYQVVKICPFATWTEDMIWAYIHAYELPYNALHDQGFPSIGCYHCTRAVQSGEDIRAGRWSDHAKTECGIHKPLVEEKSS